MDSFTSILQLLEIPTSVFKELNNLYHHCDNKEKCNQQCIITEETKSCLNNCLQNNPYETNSIIVKLTEKYNKKHEKHMENLVQNVIIENLEMCDEIDTTNIYSLLSLLENCDEFDVIFQLLDGLIQTGKLNKELVYVTLLPQQEIIKEFIEYEKQNLTSCNINDTSSLLRYCLIKNEHWLLNVLNSKFNTQNLEINQKLRILKLLFYSNSGVIDFQETQQIISQIHKINDKFLWFYLCSIKWNLEMYHFIGNTKIYLEPCLNTLSRFIDLKHLETQKFNDINRLLNKHQLYLRETENETKSEIDLYNGLCLIITIKNIILHQKNDEELLKNIKQQLFTSTNRDFLLEVLENIYAMIFLQKRHLQQNEADDFICEYSEVLFITNFLKTLVLKMKRKFYPRREKNPSFLRFQNLSNMVEILEWKLNLFKSEYVGLNDEKVIQFLVSPPETIIYYCLENDNIFGARNVVQVSSIQQTQIAQDIEYVAQFQQIKQNNVEDLIKFCSLNGKQSNLLDLLLTLDRSHETSRIIIKDLENDTLFFENLKQIFEKLNQTIPQIITSSNIPLNLQEFHEKEKHLNDLEIFYNEYLDQQSEKKFLKIAELLDLEDFNYLKKVHNYLRKLSEIYNIKPEISEEKPEIFDLIRKNTAEIVGFLLVKFNLQPKDFEKLFSKLKLDIIYKISWNFLPEIPLNINVENRSINLQHNEENLQEIVAKLRQIYVESDKLQHSPDFFLLSYIQKRNWLLAYLMNKIYIKNQEDLINSDQTKYFNNLLNVKSIRKLNKMFDNPTIAVLYNNDMIFAKLLHYIGTHDSISVLEIINGIPESLLLNNQDLIHIKDLIVYDLCKTQENNQLIHCICNNSLRIKCILENLNKWTGEFCIHILKCELMRWDLNEEHEEIIKIKFLQIELYENMKNVFNHESWNEVYEKSLNQSKEFFQLLLTSKQVLLLLKWIEIHKPASNELLPSITTDYLKLLLDNNTDLHQIKTLLDLLQFEQRIMICKNLLKNVTKNWEQNSFLVSYLTEHLPELENEYRNTSISLKIFSCFNPSEHEFMYCLINKPLLIIEQLIMNVRLEKLSLILEKIKPLLNDGCDLTTETVDELLRTYAKKALDFRGIQPAQELKNLELKLMQSLDTVSVDSERKNFVIPDQVPDKSNWVQNEQALECMCCRETIFSMFNRRHHCRRCGRVICGNCSLKKIQIPEYGSIPVRVCNDCFKQSQSDDTNQINKSEQSSTKSGSFTCWLLTDDEKHNEIAREEFSFEYAPSVSLCLSILKAHTPNIEYSRFLLDQCKVLLPYLQDGVSEIDFSFMIQMIKSLVTVAKLTALNNSFKSELIECNEILLQIELMNLLVEKDCLELLRSSIKNPSDFYNHSRVLRRLRDKLIEQEYWSLALDISTKVGLDKTGIFAAWGKSYLKAGALQMAREKFQYCLEKHQQHDPDLRDLSISYEKSINLSTVSEVRPTKTPPLINEIIYVLENNDPIQDKTLFRNFRNFKSSNLSLNVISGGDPPVCILNKLKNLKKITDKKSSKLNDLGKNNHVEFYNECLYYLMKYASHSTILQFFIRHQEFDEALNYLLENRLSIEYFVDIYMRCLEENRIEKIQQTMQKIDITLDVWEVYLKGICRHLEKNSMYNTLYQLQLFMCDYVRAAMTCIKFYQENSRNFRELLGREEHLHRAQNHLKQELEHEQWVKVTPVRKTSSASSGSSTPSISTHQLQMKLDPRNIDRYINTIWRQIEIAKFLAECETENRPTYEILNIIFPEMNRGIPTLFESTLEKTQLAVLVLVCGRNIEEGFGIAFRIIQDHNLKFLKVYCYAAQYLASILNDSSIVELINCIKTSGMTLNETCDDVLMIGVSGLVRASASGAQLDNIIKLIVNPAIKIEAFIECGQLKRAYLLAIKHNKLNEVRKILREAERLNQPQIKAICLKRLNQSK